MWGDDQCRNQEASFSLFFCLSRFLDDLQSDPNRALSWVVQPHKRTHLLSGGSLCRVNRILSLSEEPFFVSNDASHVLDIS